MVVLKVHLVVLRRVVVPPLAVRDAARGAVRLHLRVRPRCRFALLLTHFIPDSLRESVPLFLKRQCDRTLLHLPEVELRVLRLAIGEYVIK